MLASTQNLLQMCSFDAAKSTKGASKLRRDLINTEIANLRDLLPLPSSTRQRLSQLQLMALVCVYVRKANYFHNAFRKPELIPPMPLTNFGFSKALSGFLMMMTQNGKLLYISDNAAEYLGHSMEDLLIHGDSVYDIIEKQDHQTIQNGLMNSTNPHGVPNDSRIFLCRMNVSRNSRRQMRFGDQKVVLVQGHFVSYLPLCSRNEPVFLATCTPVAMPETRECVVQGSTNVFTSIHSMDMKFIHLDANGEFHLGYNKSKIKNLSWYDIVHWDYLKEAQTKHRLITQSEQERSCILLLRLQTSSFNWIWVHVVLQVKDNNENSQQPVIVCTNQVLSDKEAAVMQANSWLYQFYSLHSKMHYTMQSPATPPSNTNSSSTGTSSTSASNSSSYEPSSAASSQARSPFSANYSSSFGGNHSLHQSVPAAAAEAPSLALHPTHPSMAYYSHNGVSVGSTHYHAGGHFGSHHSMQQYSPQAGSLPYQAVSIQTSSTPSTPPASSQTEHRVKDEPSPATASTRPTKRNRASSQQDEEKRHHKKKATVNTSQTEPTPPTNGTSSSSGTSTYSNYHASSYGAYHPTGSVFGASSFGTDLSMAYYGGSMSAYHHPAAHHSQLTYSSHFQGKFPFFEHGTAGSSLTGGHAEHAHTASSRQSSSHRSRTTEEGSVLSSAFTSTVPGAHLVKPSKLYSGELSDRRELDKVRSPESSTSDYGSMSSQSPPSTFDKSFGTSSLTSSGVTSSDVDYHNHYNKSNWPGYSSASHAHSATGDKEATTASSFHLSRLSSFQFWPGYTSVTPEEAHSSAHRHPHLASTFPVDPLQTYGQNLFTSYPHHMTNHDHYNGESKSLVSRVKAESKPSSPAQPSATKPTSPSVGISVTRAL